MRILFTLHYPIDPNAGAAGYTLRLAEALAANGHDVAVQGATRLFEGLGKRPAELAFPFLASGLALRQLRSGTLDVVDASTADLWPCPAKWLRHFSGITVTRSHGLEHVESRELLLAVGRGETRVRRRYHLYYGGLHLRQVARSLRLADGAFFCNEHDRRYAISQLGVEESRAFFVRAGVADYFLGLQPPVSSGDADLGVAVIGPYSWRKGAASASAALSRILREWPQCRATWLGASVEDVLGGIDADVRGRINVLRGYENRELPSLLGGHQILLVLSQTEGFPGVVLEAMACGLVVVANDIPGPRDILQGTGAGVLVQPRNTGAVVEEVARLFRDRVLMESMRRRAHELAQTFKWRDVAAENVELYNQLAMRKRQAGSGRRL